MRLDKEDTANVVMLLICAAVFAYMYTTLTSIFVLIPLLYSTYLIGSQLLMFLLGHEVSSEPTHIYIIADPAHEEHAVAFAAHYLVAEDTDEIQIHIMDQDSITKLAELIKPE